MNNKYTQHTVLQPASCCASSPVGFEELIFMQMEPCFSSHTRSAQFPFCNKDRCLCADGVYWNTNSPNSLNQTKFRHTQLTMSFNTCTIGDCNVDNHKGDSHLSPDENTVIYVTGGRWVSKFPAGETDGRVVTPVKQPLCLSVIKSNPKLISGFCKDEEEELRIMKITVTMSFLLNGVGIVHCSASF